MKYASIDANTSAKMHPVPLKIHFAYQLIPRDLTLFRPSPLVRVLMRLVRSVFGTYLATKSVFGNAVLDENYYSLSLFSLILSEYVLTAISQSWVIIGYDHETISGVG